MVRVLSDKAIAQVREVVRRVLGEREATIRRPVYAKQGSMAYIGKTDGSGITALSGTTPGSGTVTLQEVASGGTLTARQDADANDVTATAYNLCTTAISSSTYVFLTKEMLTGKLYASTSKGGGSPGSGSSLVRVEANTFFEPGDGSTSFDLMEWNESTNQWDDSGDDVNCLNSQSDCCMLPGEQNFAVEVETGLYELLSFGLVRQVQTTAAIAIKGNGSANVMEGTTETGNSITIHNGNFEYTAPRALFNNDRVMVTWFTDKWRVSFVPRSVIVGKPQTDLQSGSTGTFDIYALNSSGSWASQSETVSARNNTGMQFDSDHFYQIVYTYDSFLPYAYPIDIEVY